MTVDWQGLIRIGLDWTKLARIGMIGNFCWNGRMILDRHCIDMDWLGLAWIGIVWKRTGLARIGVGLKMASDWNRVDVGLVRIGPGLASKWLRIGIGLAPNLLCVGRSEKNEPWSGFRFA